MGFIARIFVQATLPHSRPRTNEFKRVNRRYSLHLVAPPSVGLRYGSYPRLVLAWLNTEALRTKSPELHLGPTLSTFMHKLNLTPVTGKRGTARRLRDQLHRLLSTSIRYTNSHEVQGQVECLGYTMAHEQHLDWSPPDPSQCPRWGSTVTLSDEFFQEITTNAVPVDLRALRALKACPMALDTYTWLTYRMGYLRKPCLIPWEGLQTQFGADYGRLRDFKAEALDTPGGCHLCLPSSSSHRDGVGRLGERLALEAPSDIPPYYGPMETVEFLSEAVIVLAAAVAVVLLSTRLRIPPVVGFLISGILIGPSGLALVPETEQVEVFAEIGVVLLLFVIGLQLSSAEMRTLGRSFLVGGSLQWALTTGLTMGIVIVFGLPLANALFIGFVVSLSSTAVVLKEYHERRETTTPQGRVVLGVLLLQDLLIVPMIALTPILAGSIKASASGLILRFGGGLAAVALLFFLGRVLIRQLTRIIAGTRIRELFVLGALTTCLGMAWFTARLEFSLALGAFLAGVLVAETEYSHQVIADIGPFRDLFASIFFVSIGMLVDLPFAMTKLPALAGLVVLLVVGKALVAVAALKLAGFTSRIAVVCGIGLAQIGEFSFVLMEVGRAHGLLQGDRFQILLVAAVLTVALTPILIHIAPAVGTRIAARRRTRSGEGSMRDPALSDHVVVVGYGMNGSLLARILGETHIPYLVVELGPDAARRARGDGVPVLFGDATRKEILERAGVEGAKMIVFAISDFSAVIRSLKAARQLSPNVEIVVRTHKFKEIEDLRGAGANQVVAE
ncbi:MAG: replication protein RepA, partial [Thermoanaerobaculia bacterium]